MRRASARTLHDHDADATRGERRRHEDGEASSGDHHVGVDRSAAIGRVELAVLHAFARAGPRCIEGEEALGQRIPSRFAHAIERVAIHAAASTRKRVASSGASRRCSRCVPVARSALRINHAFRGPDTEALRVTLSKPCFAITRPMSA